MLEFFNLRRCKAYTLISAATLLFSPVLAQETAAIFTLKTQGGVTAHIANTQLSVLSMSEASDRTTRGMVVECESISECAAELNNKICLTQEKNHSSLDKIIAHCQTARAIVIYDDSYLGPNNGHKFASQVPVIFLYSQEVDIIRKLKYTELVINDFSTVTEAKFACSSIKWQEKWAVSFMECIQHVDMDEILIVAPNQHKINETYLPNQMYFQPQEIQHDGSLVLIELTPALLPDNIDASVFKINRETKILNKLHANITDNQKWLIKTTESASFVDSELFFSGEVLTEKRVEIPFVIHQASINEVRLTLNNDDGAFQLIDKYCEENNPIIPSDHLDCWAVLRFKPMQTGSYLVDLEVSQTNKNESPAKLSIKALAMEVTQPFDGQQPTDRDLANNSDQSQDGWFNHTNTTISDEDRQILKSTTTRGEAVMRTTPSRNIAETLLGQENINEDFIKTLDEEINQHLYDVTDQ